MTPEEAGIFNTDVHMKKLLLWLNKYNIKEFQTCDVPDHFKGKFMLRAANNGYLLKVRNDQGNNQAWWGIGPKYLKYRGCIPSTLYYGGYEVALTEERVEEAIKEGYTTGNEMAKYVGINRNTALKYLKRYREAGLFAFEKIHLTYHYSLKEA